MSILLVDNTSPFTKDILLTVRESNKSFFCKLYSEIDISDLSKYRSIILSGRQKISKETNVINSKIIRHCYGNNIPLLGICYGAEIINLYFGGSLIKMDTMIQGLVKITTHKKNRLLPKNSSFYAYHSHKYSVSKLAPDLSIIASSELNKYEFFAHKLKKIFGVQFHPEKSDNICQSILTNFVNI